jgi:MFS transporter, DHA2 family, multidrug resistance protein
MTAASPTPNSNANLSEKPTVPRHVIVGIIAVSLAAINSTLGSGMISTGLEDLRGAWGLGVDEAAYIPTAFNAGQMFMGPLSVILAARFGHRQVLLYGGGIYVLASLFLPLVPPTVPILLLLIIAGLASGTFYPLCLSFISRNLPLTLVTYGVAAYNLDLLATNHVVQALEGFYMDHFSFHWLFWNQAILSLPLLACIYFGIPATPKDQLLPHFSYVGMLYVSGGLTLLYIALDQGERLDWYNNGLVNGLLIAGSLLLIASIIRRRTHPNPHLDFSYLKTRNVLILAFLLITFRTMLLRIGLLIPQFLERLHQYRPTETGQLFTLSLPPFLLAMPLIAYFGNKVRVRILLMLGFFILALCNFYDAHALSTWINADLATAQLCGAVGICLVAMGTMSGIVFAGRLSGAYRNRAGAYCQGAFFQAVRLFGSQSTTSAMRRFILFREHFWQTKLVSGIQNYGHLDETVQTLATAVASQVAGPTGATAVATGLIAMRVQSQAFTLAIDDSFMLLGCVSVISLFAVMMMKRVPLPHQLPAADAPLTTQAKP